MYLQKYKNGRNSKGCERVVDLLHDVQLQASASAIAHSSPGNHLHYLPKKYKRVNFSRKSLSVVLIPEDCQKPSTMQTVS